MIRAWSVRETAPMTSLENVAPAFVDMAHQIVWATAATISPDDRPRTRILHPLWVWDGTTLVGWIATGPTPLKKADLDHRAFVSLNYWAPNHDTCRADCVTTWHFDDATRERTWNMFKDAPAPVGYDPAIIPAWSAGPTSPAFAALELTPQFLRVFPGPVLLGGPGEVLTWSAA
jgi:hypothetical protein